MAAELQSSAGSEQVIEVTAPSRLHFGLLSFGLPDGRQFGGAGLMLGEPFFRLRVRRADAFDVVGKGADRVRGFAKAWASYHQLDRLPNCQIDVLATLPDHVGLGSGTQMALGTARGLDQFCDHSPKSPVDLAISVGRGLRSAVGTYGFCVGGFIAEAGKVATETLAPLVERIDVPSEWRFLLVRPSDLSGNATDGIHGGRICGDVELAAFSRLPPVPRDTTKRLVDEMHERMIPALNSADCAAFGESVYQYGLLAGQCFADCQGGPFATKRLATIVEFLRGMGVTGVGQSSWGPTLFAILPNHAAAEKLVERLRSQFGGDIEFCVSPPNNVGAAVSV